MRKRKQTKTFLQTFGTNCTKVFWDILYIFSHTHKHTHIYHELTWKLPICTLQCLSIEWSSSHILNKYPWLNM